MESDMKGGILHATMPPHHPSSIHSHSSPYGSLGPLGMMNLQQSQLTQSQLSHQTHNMSHMTNNSSNYNQQTHISPVHQQNAGMSPNHAQPPTTQLNNHHITSTGPNVVGHNAHPHSGNAGGGGGGNGGSKAAQSNNDRVKRPMNAFMVSYHENLIETKKNTLIKQS